MAMTAAQRQARYREKLKFVDKARREFVLSPEALDQLGRLARHWELPAAGAVERAIAEAERAATSEMSRKQRVTYFGR